MADIVERLRQGVTSVDHYNPNWLLEAADEIERLRQERDDARECAKVLKYHFQGLQREWEQLVARWEWLKEL